jgi:hypothetical protein
VGDCVGLAAGDAVGASVGLSVGSGSGTISMGVVQSSAMVQFGQKLGMHCAQESSPSA